MFTTWLIIGTDIMLANLFQNTTLLSFEDIEIFQKFLVLGFYRHGTTVISDFCEESVRYVAERYPTLFRLLEDSDGKLFVEKVAQPNLKFFNQFYNNGEISFIGRLVANFLCEKERVIEIVENHNKKFR